MASWFTTSDVDEFVAAAGGFLRAFPAQHTVLLTALESLRVRGPNAFGSAAPRFGYWRGDGGDVMAAFMQTPPHPLVLTDVPGEAVASMPVNLGGAGLVNVEHGVARAVAARLWPDNGATVQVRQRMRLYRLGELVPPDPPPPGRARPAVRPDLDLLRSWYEVFLSEIGEHSGDPAADIDDRIGYGGLHVWEVDGEPVSMAGRTRAAAGMVRIGPVFTPVRWRRRGYAGAVTAEVSARAREIATEVLLFTNLANPTSNAIYQRLGFRPVQDRVLLATGEPLEAAAPDH